MKFKLKIFLERIGLVEQKLVDESTLAQCVHWEFDELRLRCQALGIDEDRQKQAYVDLFRGVSAERWNEADRRISAIRAKLTYGTPAAVALELARNPGPTPPAKTLSDLEAAAREHRAAGKHYADFVPSVWQDVLALAPVPGPIREWLAGGLSSIASGHASKLGPRPADPVCPSQEEVLRHGEAVAKQQLENREAMEENQKAGRGKVVSAWK